MEDYNISDPDSCPILLLPRKSTTLETNCDTLENVYMNLNITAVNPTGNSECIYSGFCNIKIVDKYQVTLDSLDVSPVNLEDIEENTQSSEVWIDPARSPYVYNNWEGENETYIENNITQSFTVQQHNTYVTQNVFNCNDNSRYNYGDLECRRVRQSNDAGENTNLVNCDMYAEDEFECGVMLSQLSEEILNEERARERQLLSENNAFKQLLSTNKRHSNQQRTILLIGNDRNNVRTVQSISVNDPYLECNGDVGAEVVVDDSAESGSQKIYQCNNCKQIFDNTSAFRQHIQVGHRVSEYNDMISDDYLKSYLSDRENEPPIYFKCEKCGKTIKSQDKYIKHINGHGNPDLECTKCHKVYASKGSLKVHQKLHKRQCPCPWCSHTFNTTQELNVHITKTHSMQDKLSEEVAIDISETTTSSLPAEYMENEGSIKWVVNKKADAVLEKVMSNKAFLLSSKLIKRQPKKTCDICLKNFNRISDLKRHLIEHIVKSTLSKAPVSRRGILRIECIVCKNKIFSRIDKYKAHLRQHAKLTIYECTFCNKSFSDSSNFSKHKKIHSAAPYHCDMCHRKFQTKRMIAKHMEYHLNNLPMPCEFCGKVFHFSSTLTKHMKNYHKAMVMKNHQCLFCNVCFKSLREKLDHEWSVHKIRRRVIDCLLCGQKFRKYSQLKEHCFLSHSIKIPMAKDLVRDKGLCKKVSLDP